MDDGYTDEELQRIFQMHEAADSGFVATCKRLMAERDAAERVAKVLAMEVLQRRPSLALLDDLALSARDTALAYPDRGGE